MCRKRSSLVLRKGAKAKIGVIDLLSTFALLSTRACYTVGEPSDRPRESLQ